MAIYLVTDGHGDTIEIHARSPERAAWEYVDSASWDQSGGTLYFRIRTRLKYRHGNWEWHDITLHPPEPDCTRKRHSWRSPYSLLGGLDVNPGVWGHGGGVIIREVCRHCGHYRVTDTWAQNPETGEQGLTSIRYVAPDEKSLAWIEGKKCAYTY